MKRIVYIKCGGLMEDPMFHWEVLGEGEGDTLKEVMADILTREPSLASLYNEEYGTVWGWSLSLTRGDVDACEGA